MFAELHHLRCLPLLWIPPICRLVSRLLVLMWVGCVADQYNLNSIYWGWQEKNGGRNRLKYDVSEMIVCSAYRMLMGSIPQGLHKGTTDPVSVNDMCPMLSLGTNWTVADVMDSREEPGCFTVSSAANLLKRLLLTLSLLVSSI